MPETPENTEKLVRLGKIVGFQGLQGAVKVRLSDDEPDWLDSLKTVTLKTPRQTFVLTIRRARLKGPRQGIIEFEGYPDRTRAEKELAEGELFAPLSCLPEPAEGEYWADDLIGMAVIDASGGQELGRVKDLLSSTGGDYLEISVDGGETVLIPFIDEFFPVVEPENKRLTVARLEDFLRDAAQKEKPVEKS